MKKNITQLCVCIMLLGFSLNGRAQGAISGFYNQKGTATLVLGAGFEDSKNYFIGREKSDLSRNLYSISIFGIYCLEYFTFPLVYHLRISSYPKVLALAYNSMAIFIPKNNFVL